MSGNSCLIGRPPRALTDRPVVRGRCLIPDCRVAAPPGLY